MCIFFNLLHFYSNLYMSKIYAELNLQRTGAVNKTKDRKVVRLHVTNEEKRSGAKEEERRRESRLTVPRK